MSKFELNLYSQISFLSDKLAMSHRSTNSQFSDMDDHGEMKSYAIKVSTTAIEEQTKEKDQAFHIKHAFETKFGPTWHVVVGTDFKGHVTYEAKTFFFFYIGKVAVCLFKTN